MFGFFVSLFNSWHKFGVNYSLANISKNAISIFSMVGQGNFRKQQTVLKIIWH